MDNTKKYLTETEVNELLTQSKKLKRNKHRNTLLILLMFRHGLRCRETINLEWTQIDLTGGRIQIRRVKNGFSTTHPLKGDEIRLLRKVQRKNPTSKYVFLSERKTPIAQRTVHHIVKSLGEAAGFTFKTHPHMLRHACGHVLAEKGVDTRSLQDYLGHKNIRHTVLYTQGSSRRFDTFF